MRVQWAHGGVHLVGLPLRGVALSVARYAPLSLAPACPSRDPTVLPLTGGGRLDLADAGRVGGGSRTDVAGLVDVLRHHHAQSGGDVRQVRHFHPPATSVTQSSACVCLLFPAHRCCRHAAPGVHAAAERWRMLGMTCSALHENSHRSCRILQVARQSSVVRNGRPSLLPLVAPYRRSRRAHVT